MPRRVRSIPRTTIKPVEPVESGNDITEQQAKLASFAFPTVHVQLRDLLDPDAEYIDDNTLQKVIRTVGGNGRRAAHRCLLYLLHYGRETKNPALVAFSRKQTLLLESGILEIR